MIGIKKCLAMALSSAERSLFTDIPPFPSSACPRHTRDFIHSSRHLSPAVVCLIKRIINTYNGFLTPLWRPMLLFCRATRPLRGIRDGATFFLRLHFSLSHTLRLTRPFRKDIFIWIAYQRISLQSIMIRMFESPVAS